MKSQTIELDSQISDGHYNIPIYSPMHYQQTNLSIQIPMDIIHTTTISALKQAVIKKIGYASRINLYIHPVNAFNMLDFYRQDETTIGYILQTMVIGDDRDVIYRLAIMYNNTQYRQQPDYYSLSSKFTTAARQQSCEMILQIVQNNYFVHDSYRVPLSNKISFMRGIANKYGGSIWVQYYNVSLQLSIFGDSRIAALCSWMDLASIITISVESNLNQGGDKGRMRIVSNIDNINFHKFYCLQWSNIDNVTTRYIIVSRKSRLSSTLALLQIVLNRKFVVKIGLQQKWLRPGSAHKQIEDHIKVIQIKNDPELYSPVFIPRINFCQLLPGPTQLYKQSKSYKSTIILIEQSSIAHRLSIHNNANSQHRKIVKIQLCHHHESKLPCASSRHFDEDLFYIHCDQGKSIVMIGYSITIHGITVKYYTTMGKLLYIKKYGWHKGDIEFKVNDFFCLKSKPELLNSLQKQYKNVQQYSPSLRIFYVHQPDDFMDINNMSCNAFYPARSGFNSCSDGSGLFAISNQWRKAINVYQFSGKSSKIQKQARLQQEICSIKIKQQKVTDIFFSQLESDNKDRLLCVNYQNKTIQVYNLDGKLITSILCLPGMKNIFFIGKQIVSCSDTQLYTFRMDGICSWGQPSYIPLNTAIINSGTGQVLNPIDSLQFYILDGFYVYQ